MALSRDEVRNIAHLARLRVTEEEMDRVVSNLSRIIEFVDQLKAAETDQVQPMAHPLQMSQRLRPDEVTETVERELYQRNAPQTHAGLYLVPKVIE